MSVKIWYKKIKTEVVWFRLITVGKAEDSTKNVGIAYIQILQGPLDIGAIKTLSWFETLGSDFKMT
jgi:hypothetical protein